MKKNQSRYLSLILRHKPEQEDLTLDSNGYCDIDDLIYKLDISKLDLDEIVETNNKKRFEYNGDETMIRATQGHSVDVDLIARYLTTIKTNSNIVLKQLKAFKEG